MRAYRPPGKLTWAVNRLVAWLATNGFTPPDTVTLEVQGRRSGIRRPVVLTWTEYGGDRYFVSLRGEAEWVRNLRAAHGKAVIRHGGTRPVLLEEMPIEQRAPVLKAYVSKRALTKSPAQSARQYFGMAADPPLEALAAVAAQYPVFRIAQRDASGAGGGI